MVNACWNTAKTTWSALHPDGVIWALVVITPANRVNIKMENNPKLFSINGTKKKEKKRRKSLSLLVRYRYNAMNIILISYTHVRPKKLRYLFFFKMFNLDNPFQNKKFSTHVVIIAPKSTHGPKYENP